MNLFSFLHRMGKENMARWLGLFKEGGSLGRWVPGTLSHFCHHAEDEREARCLGAPGQCRLNPPLRQSGPTQQVVRSQLSKWWAWTHLPPLWGKRGRGEMGASFLKNAFHCSLTPPTQERGWRKPEEELLTFLLQKVRLVVVPSGFLSASLKCARGTQKWEGDIRLTYPASTIGFAHLEIFFEHQILAFIFFKKLFVWLELIYKIVLFFGFCFYKNVTSLKLRLQML